MPVRFIYLLLALASLAFPARSVIGAEAENAQSDHARGSCGSLGAGTGLADGKGWVVSMLPGRHEFRMSHGGAVRLTAARAVAWDFDPGRPYYIAIENAPADSALEWKVPGKSGWTPVPRTFLYPPQGNVYRR